MESINSLNDLMMTIQGESGYICEKRNQIQTKKGYFDLSKQILVVIYVRLEMS